MGFFFRFGIVLLMMYWLVMAIMNREVIFRPEPHNFEKAAIYGFNKIVKCEFPRIFSCDNGLVSIFAVKEMQLLDQDVDLIRNFVAIPAVPLVALFFAENVVTMVIFGGVAFAVVHFVLLKES
jgi:hypothetical protein